MEVERKPLEFRAGKMDYDPKTKGVTPDKSNGILRVEEKEGETHLSWINLDSHNEEINLMVFQNDAHIQVLAKRNLIVLWFDSFQDRYFFWLQDPKLKLQEVADQIQRFINGQGEPVPNQPSSEPEKKPSALDSQTVPTQATAKPQPQQPALNIDSFIKDLTKKMEAKKQVGGGRTQYNVEPLSLSDIVNIDFIKFIAENYDEKYLQHLPEGQQKEEFYKENVHSPQLQQAVDALNDALNTEDGIAIFHEMRLDPSFLQHFYGTEAFLRALEKWGKEQPK